MSPRDIAYSIVKKMKAAYTKDGCDWQKAIEAELEKLLPAVVENHEDDEEGHRPD